MSGPDHESAHGQVIDPVLESALRTALWGRDPGSATPDLRRRVDRIPGEVAPRGEGRLRPVIPYLAVAAALVVLVGGLGVLASGRPGAGDVPGSDPALQAFDPYATGIGVVDPPSQPLVVLVVVVATALAFYGAGVLGGRKGGALALLFVVIPGAFLVTQVLRPPVMTGGGTGPGVVSGDDLGWEPGDRAFAVVTADAGEPYQVALVVSNPGPVPIRLEGIVPAGNAGVDGTASLWIDQASPDGFSEPGAPFTPVTLGPGAKVVLWLVQRANACAAGAAVEGTGTAGGVTQSAMSIRWSLLGIVPREDGIELPYYVTTPFRDGCTP